MSWLKQWWDLRSLRSAYAVLSEHGLTAVRLRVVAGSTYVETVDGQMMKLGRPGK